jgi:peroxiredoxin
MKRIALALATLTLLASPAFAGKFNKVLSIGDAGPDFKAVIGTDDKPHSLSDYNAAKAVVVVFTCNHCPVAQAYEDRLMALQKDYKEKGVQLVAINVNNNDADKLEAMKERAGIKGFNFPYLYDSTQKSAASYGATVTPHVFVLDGQRKVAYMGLIDDSMNAGEVKQHYVRDALDAVLAGKAPEVTETRQLGCGIQYEKK